MPTSLAEDHLRFSVCDKRPTLPETLTATPTLPALWASLSTIRLTHEISHHISLFIYFFIYFY